MPGGGVGTGGDTRRRLDRRRQRRQRCRQRNRDREAAVGRTRRAGQHTADRAAGNVLPMRTSAPAMPSPPSTTLPATFAGAVTARPALAPGVGTAGTALPPPPHAASNDAPATAPSNARPTRWGTASSVGSARASALASVPGYAGTSLPPNEFGPASLRSRPRSRSRPPSSPSSCAFQPSPNRCGGRARRSSCRELGVDLGLALEHVERGTADRTRA